MDEKTFGRLVIGACLVVLLLLALTGCAAPVASSKPSIPDDLRLVCYQGVIAVMSESAEEAMVSNVPCDVEKI